MSLYKKYRKAIKIMGPYILNLGAAGVIAYFHIFDSNETTNTDYIKKSMITLTVSTAVTQIFFAIATYKIVRQSWRRKVKDFENKSRVVMLGVFS